MMNLKQKVSWLIPIAYVKSISQTKKILVGLAIGSVSLFGSCKKDKVDAETINLKAGEALSNTSALAAVSIPTKAEALLAMEVYNNHFYNQYGTYNYLIKHTIGRTTITQEKWISGPSRKQSKHLLMPTTSIQV